MVVHGDVPEERLRAFANAMQWQQLMERQWKTDKMRMTATTPVKAKKRNQQTRAQCLMRVGIQFPDPKWIELLQEPNPKKGSGLKN